MLNCLVTSIGSTCRSGAADAQQNQERLQQAKKLAAEKANQVNASLYAQMNRGMAAPQTDSFSRSKGVTQGSAICRYIYDLLHLTLNWERAQCIERGHTLLHSAAWDKCPTALNGGMVIHARQQSLYSGDSWNCFSTEFTRDPAD